MVEKSRRRMAGPVGPAALAHLDVSPPYSPDADDVGRDGSSPSPQPAQLAQLAQPEERRAYRHHASKAERLVGLGLGLSHLDQPPKPRPASPASPSSVYVVPEQRKIGLSAPSAPAGPADFRVPSPVQLPKSFSLVDSVARLERLERRAETKEAKERPVSVREILGRLDKAEPKADPPRETIIEIAKLDGDSRRDFSRIHTTLDSERTNGPITDSVIFRDYRPTSPGDFSSSRLVTSRRSQVEPSRSPTPDARLDTRLNARSPVPDARIESRIHARSPVPDGRIESRIHAKSPAPEARIDSRTHTRSPVPDARIESRIHARSPVPDARQDKRFETRLDARLDALVDLDQRSRPRRGSPVAVSARSPSAEAKARDSREYLHSRAQPGGHHIDVVEKFLRSERSHADERRQRVERHRRSRSREADAEAADEDRRRRRSQGREEASRERSREARRSRSRDELEALEAVDRRLPSRSRSRSQDELELGRGRRHRADGDLADRPHRDAAGHGEARRRSRSRDALEDMNHNGEARQRSRSRDALEDVNHHHDVRQRSRSRDILDRISPEHHRQRHSRQESNLGRGGRSREELDHPIVVADPRPAENGTGGPERRPRTADRKRPEVSKERPPEAAERRHRCKCAERSTQGDAKQGRPADKGSRTHVHVHSGEKGSRGHEAPSHCLRRSRAPAITDKADKTDKLVRKTRTHVAALASPLVQLVKPARRQNEVRRSGDIHLVMEPIRPVRRPAAPAKQSNPPAPAAPTATRGSSKLLACKRLSGTISDSNSSLSQGKPVAATERPARRNHKRQPTTDA